MTRGVKTNKRKKKQIAQAKAMDEDTSSYKLAEITGVPATTIQGLIKDDEEFKRFVQEAKKRLKVEYVDLIQKHAEQMREKMGRASYRDIVGGFKIVHEKAFPEDSAPGVAQQFVTGGDMKINFKNGRDTA